MWRLLLLVACLQGALSLRVTRPSTSRIVRVDAGRQSWHARSSLHMIGDLHEPLLHAVSAMDTLFHSAHAPTEHLAWHSDAIHSNGLFLSDETSAAASPALNPSPSDVSVYSKVDKTGFIGFFANGIEICIDFVHTLLNGIGVQYSYGISIIMFTIFVKAVTLPLTTSQLASTTKMQKLAPYQQKIQAKYANDEQTKNQLLAQLFQAAQVNPLAGCLPALVQIPIFISLYRALQNLIAENKLDEPFLWIPDLEGPVYSAPPGESLDWIKSAITGNPQLGWEQTAAFASIPIILYISQTISMKILQPPKDPNRVLTDQEQFSQNLVNNLPFIVAFFSLNVPAGLGLYWVVNNILTTIITIVVKEQFKNDQMPPEVTQMMAMLDGPSGSSSGAKSGGGGRQELGRTSVVERPKKEGFGTPSMSSTSSSSTMSKDSSSSGIIDATIVTSTPTSNDAEDNDNSAGNDEDSEGSGGDDSDKKNRRQEKGGKKGKKRRN